MKSFYEYISLKLDSLRRYDLYRKINDKENKIGPRTNGIELNIDALGLENYICFSSNDYLGLANNEVVLDRTIKELKQYGSGSTGSRLISGNTKAHVRLEDKIAKYKNKEKALLFGSGYLANLALLSSLATLKDLILGDELNHASIMDGCRLSRAYFITYPHCDMDFIRDYLKKERHKARYVFIVTDALFSMDGDIVPLKDLYEICSEFDAIPILDEAHSTGVLGPKGEGIESFLGISYSDGIIMGTLSKALGSYGAFVCAKEVLIDYLINKARPFIYTTALSPADVLNSYHSLCLIEENPNLIKALKNNIRYIQNSFKEHLSLDFTVGSPIMPIILGQRTMEVARSLLSKGLYVQGIRPPTVPYGLSRLRITISSIHKKEEIDYLITKLRQILQDELPKA